MTSLFYFSNFCNFTGQKNEGMHNFGMHKLKSFNPGIVFLTIPLQLLVYAQIDSLFLRSVLFSFTAAVVKGNILRLSMVHFSRQSWQEWLCYKDTQTLQILRHFLRFKRGPCFRRISAAPHISAASAYYLEEAIYLLYGIWNALVTKV